MVTPRVWICLAVGTLSATAVGCQAGPEEWDAPPFAAVTLLFES